ncbi:hypothetical protein [Prescottella equi]|uniref:Uncharacterized protein n=1 Tax=Prescottella equi ATCC 33707 TaxID=525370 RepID=E9SXM9_RHOHA|nr:hypothetical protein [Prescottella equi]EGD25313.1 hypothetical protein HMPREF0724_11094 [Prescottella equi ATCC 33707]
MEHVGLAGYALCLLLPTDPVVDPQLENITRISTNFKARHEGRGIWERTLTCGHRVQQSVHHTNSTPSFNLVSSIGDDHSAVLGCGAHRELGEPRAAEDVGGRP